MAKKKKKQENDDLILDVESAYSNTENYIVNNKKSLTFITLAIVAIFGGYFGYQKLYVQPMEQEAKELSWKAEYYFSVDSFELAINGFGEYEGFAYIADEYSGTKQGNLANYYLGVSYLYLGQYQLAIDHLDQVNVDDQIISTMAIGNQGDAYLELNQYPQGIAKYEEAANNSDNEFTAPYYLQKAALAYESTGEWGKAVDTYKRIRDEYPESTEGREVEKFLARAEGKVGA